mmetsp:Transcript_1045/g.2697  ORF Transcript_1045/g.2697 Transcript_1045/m.2697 type:complete len:310 (-) Transcript_1045:1067-1996(-)
MQGAHEASAGRPGRLPPHLCLEGAGRGADAVAVADAVCRAVLQARLGSVSAAAAEVVEDGGHRCRICISDGALSDEPAVERASLLAVARAEHTWPSGDPVFDAPLPREAAALLVAPVHILDELVLSRPIHVVPARVLEQGQRDARDEGRCPRGRHRGHELVVEQAALPMRPKHHTRRRVLVLKLGALQIRAIEVLPSLLHDSRQRHLDNAMRQLERPLGHEAGSLGEGGAADGATALREAPLVELVCNSRRQIHVRLARPGAPIDHLVRAVVAIERNRARELRRVAGVPLDQRIALGIPEVLEQARAEA